MEHYTYKTTSKSGKYYVGRHSTNNLDDGYLGSGKWILSMKDKSQLRTIMLNTYDTFEELVTAEEILISEHIDEPLNMNFNDNAIGFASGKLNPSCTPEARLRNSLRTAGEGNAMFGKTHSDEAKAKLSRANSGEGNPMFGKTHGDEVRNKMSALAKIRANTEEGRKMLSDNGKKGKGKPTWNKGLKNAFKLTEEAKDKISASWINRPKIICEHCGTAAAAHVAKRWHGDNCKYREVK